MNRPPAFNSRSRLIGLLVVLLQVVGALHFALIQHGYSASLGGVVHFHASAKTEQQPAARALRAPGPALVADSLSCTTDRCPAADAPHGSLPRVELQATGYVGFGEVRLLAEGCAHSPESRRLFLSAPKTSPPV